MPIDDIDKLFMLKVIEKFPILIRQASKNIREDINFILEAKKRNPNVMKWVSDDVRQQVMLRGELGSAHADTATSASPVNSLGM